MSPQRPGSPLSVLVGALGLLLTLAGGPARARSRTPVRAELAAPADCPSADEFLDLLLQHAPGARPGRAEEPARSFRAEVTRTAEGYRGRLRSTSTARAGEREVTGASCREVVEALAVSAAFSLRATPASVPDDAAAARGAESPDGAGPVDEVPRRATEAKRSSGRSSSSSLPAAHRPWMIGAGGALLAGAVPVALGGFADLRWAPAVAPGVGPAAFALRARFAAALEATSEPGARLGLLALGADACPLWWPVADARMDACVSAEVGVLSARGRGLPEASDGALPWAGVGASLRGFLPVHERLSVSLRLGLLGLLSRPRLLAEAPERELWQAGPVAVDTALGLGVRL